MTQSDTAVGASYIALVFLVAFFGNLTTVVVIPLYRELQSTTNFYILNLAIADLLICVTSTPMRIVFTFKGSLLACKINTFGWIFFFNASVFAILFIAIDRYVFICQPLYYRTHCISMKIKHWIALSWVLAFILAIMPFTTLPYLGKSPNAGNKAICSHKVLIGAPYLLLLILLTEILPPMVFCLLYSKIIRVARKHAVEIAIQFSNNSSLEMDWLERRRFTESPFENPTCFLQATDEPEGSELLKIRAVLYKNYDSWKRKRREEIREKAEVIGSDDGPTFQDDQLSQVGRSLREWKRRAMGVTDRSLIHDGKQPDREMIENESRKKQFSRNQVAPTKSDGGIDYRTRRSTEMSRFTDNNHRQTLRRFLSLGVVKSDRSKSGSNVYDNDQKQTPNNGSRKGPFLLASWSKFSVAANEKKKTRSRKLKIYKEFKAVKMLGMVVGMFVLLHLPIAIMDLISLFSDGLKLPQWTVTVALYLTRLSPAINPMIYVITKREFRYAFVRLWSCGRIKKRLVHG